MKQRAEQLQALGEDRVFDIAIIGGGATGAGIAVDAASRGYSVVLLERADFGSGTSSRSTKLVHGGVRYLKQGNLSLVMEALAERGRLLHNAPHLVSDLRFVVPNYDFWEAPFYGIGMKLYDTLAGKYRFGRSKILSKEQTLKTVPNLSTAGLRGGVEYHDGQFDDARLLINLLETASSKGALCVNYLEVSSLEKDEEGMLTGLVARDTIGDVGEVEIKARSFVNATGCFCESLLAMDAGKPRKLVAPSQGAHLVLDRSFLPGDAAILVPQTSDGRVIFAVPWQNHALIGTTDTPLAEASAEPQATAEEIEFLLRTAGHYLEKVPTAADILAVHCGIRPLIRAGDEKTASLSRDHHIEISASGLLTIAGGKWTTYRKMAEDAVDHLALLGDLPERPCITRELAIHGSRPAERSLEQFPHLAYYGSDQEILFDLVQQNPELKKPYSEEVTLLPVEVIFALQSESAQTLADVLLRRSRIGMLREKATLEIAPQVADLMGAHLGWSAQRREDELAQLRQLLSPARYHLPSLEQAHQPDQEN